jgi:hypothetical protein
MIFDMFGDGAVQNLTIDKEELLKEALKTNINLFTEAGVSTLPDISGRKLPTAKMLSGER